LQAEDLKAGGIVSLKNLKDGFVVHYLLEVEVATWHQGLY
jgi:hypothetical protein